MGRCSRYVLCTYNGGEKRGGGINDAFYVQAQKEPEWIAYLRVVVAAQNGFFFLFPFFSYSHAFSLSPSALLFLGAL